MEFIPAKQILSTWSNGDSWFGSNYSMNIYKGCSHGCIYCDSRSECYQVDNFDQVRAKTDVIALLDKELGAKRRKGIVANGAMSDPYNLFERKHRLTRDALKLLDKHRFGASILTKSDSVIRDIDLLTQIRAHSPVVIKFTITTADDLLARKLEPRVASPSQRFAALKRISSEGIYTGILVWPILPFITDIEESFSSLVQKAVDHGVKFVCPAPFYGVTLRQNQRVYFYQQLDQLFPGLKQQYISEYGGRYECCSPHKTRLQQIIGELCELHGLLHRMSDIRDAIVSQRGCEQLPLFN